MVGAADGHTRAVAVAKVLLPLVALALLALLFVLSRPGGRGEPVAPGDLSEEQLAREERLGAPSYSAVTEDGARIAVAAESLKPDPDRPGVITGRDLVARVTTEGGFGWDMQAAAGEIDQQARRTTLSGGVVVETSEGYRLTTERAVMRSDLTRLEAPGRVAATGPLGELTAASMTLTGDPETGEGAVMVFKGGVRLIYRPEP